MDSRPTTDLRDHSLRSTRGSGSYTHEQSSRNKYRRDSNLSKSVFPWHPREIRLMCTVSASFVSDVEMAQDKVRVGYDLFIISELNFSRFSVDPCPRAYHRV